MRRQLANPRVWLLAAAVAILVGAGLWFACDPGTGGNTALPAGPLETPASAPELGSDPTPANAGGAALATQRLPFDERAGRMAIRMAAASKAFRGDGWRAKFATTREDLTAIFGYQETQMSPEDFRVFRAALEIVANPAELSAWQRRLGPVEIPSDRLQRMQERRQRFENWKLEYRELLRQHRERIREGGGNPQGSDRCGSAVVQDDADCELCDAECWEEADRRVAPLWMWQEDVAAR